MSVEELGDRTHYNSVLEITVSFLGIHKWEPDINIGFSPALYLQCVPQALDEQNRIVLGTIYESNYTASIQRIWRAHRKGCFLYRCLGMVWLFCFLFFVINAFFVFVKIYLTAFPLHSTDIVFTAPQSFNAFFMLPSKGTQVWNILYVLLLQPGLYRPKERFKA